MIPADWRPTLENIRALPEPLRRYIMYLETDCDPAGTIRSELLLREHVVPELEAQMLEQRAELLRAHSLMAFAATKLARRGTRILAAQLRNAVAMG